MKHNVNFKYMQSLWKFEKLCLKVKVTLKAWKRRIFIPMKTVLDLFRLSDTKNSSLLNNELK